MSEERTTYGGLFTGMRKWTEGQLCWCHEIVRPGMKRPCSDECMSSRGVVFQGVYCRKQIGKRCDYCQHLKSECVCLPWARRCRDCTGFQECSKIVDRCGRERQCCWQPRRFTPSVRPHYVFAERCDGPFLMGWWLYCIPLLDGRPEPYTSDRCEWLRYSTRSVVDLAARLGIVLPQPTYDAWDRGRVDDEIAYTFANLVPGGLMVDATSPASRDWLSDTVRFAPADFATYAACGDPTHRDASSRVGPDSRSFLQLSQPEERRSVKLVGNLPYGWTPTDIAEKFVYDDDGEFWAPDEPVMADCAGEMEVMPQVNSLPCDGCPVYVQQSFAFAEGDDHA